MRDESANTFSRTLDQSRGPLGEEILRYAELNCLDLKDCCILDDLSPADLAPLQSRLVQTDPAVGFTAQDRLRVVSMFGPTLLR